jgi:hypothetical protein
MAGNNWGAALRLATLGLALGLSISIPAQEPLSILGYTKSTSFWMEIPKGWRSDTEASRRTGAMFILEPDGYTFGTAPAIIVASSYGQTSLDLAMSKDKASFLAADPDAKLLDQPPLVAKSGAGFSIRQFRSKKLQQQAYETVAYHSEGIDVLTFTLSAKTEAQFDSGQAVFANLLGTYEASRLKVKTSP